MGATHGNYTFTDDDTFIQLNEAGVRAECHIHNSGPALIRVTLRDQGIGVNEGYPLAAGERETFIHGGPMYVRCPSASPGTPTTFDFLTSGG